MGPARQTQLDRDRLRNVGEARPCSDRTRVRTGAEGKDWDVLARVIEATESRIVPVVRCDHAKVGGPYRGFDSAEPPIEGLKTGRITRNVAAMAPFGVEVDQVDED